VQTSSPAGESSDPQVEIAESQDVVEPEGIAEPEGMAQPEDMSHLFLSPGEGRLDAETRGRALEWLLARFPDEPVAAFAANGFFAEMPASIPLRDNVVVDGRSGLDGTSSDADRQGMIEAWVRMLAVGANHYVLPRPGLSDVTCYWLDLQDLHGIVFAVFVGISPEERATDDPEARVIAKPRPRFASMRKDEYAAILSVDEAFTELLGWTTEELREKRSLDLLHPEEHALATENWMEMLSRPGPARRLRERFLHKDGSWVWFEVTNHNLLGDPDSRCITCEMVDISDEMAAQEALRAREQLLDRLTAALPVGVLQIDDERRVVFANERLRDILGVPPSESLEGQLEHVLPADRLQLESAVEAVLGEGLDAELEVALMLPGADDVRHCTLTLRPLSHDDGTVSGAIACVDDVTERMRMQNELERRATHDDLTGCHNRASVMSALERNIASGRRKADRAVMFVDLDGFKYVNDHLGHAAGDDLLRRVAGRLLDVVRETDIVGRIGGDEFLVVCPEIGGPEPALRLAERISEAMHREALETAIDRADSHVSIGVAWSAGRALDADALVAMADRAMYESKRDRSGTPMLAPPAPATASP
jgi:diguanylate cyclase (GGDEF)-like protein/PAS domain S-box-containing protein